MPQHLADLTIASASTLIASGELSPVELVEACLQRAVEHEPTINAFITLAGETALDDARTLEAELTQRGPRSPLHGIPIAIKDLIDVEGLPTTAGSVGLDAEIATVDAPVVQRLRSDGAVIIGKTNLHELALGGTSVNPHFGPVRNPYDPARIAGGSSGGSAAAVAAGMCLGAVGSDTGGSIRQPSAFCNLVGLRPPIGRIPTDNVFGLSHTLDTIGPMARTVQDCVTLYNSMAGESIILDLDGSIRVGVVRSNYFWKYTHDDVAQACEDAFLLFEELGLPVVDIKLDDLREVRRAAGTLSIYEPALRHDAYVQAFELEFGEDVQALLQRGATFTKADYHTAIDIKAGWEAQLAQVFKSVDVLLTPTAPLTAPTLEAVSNPDNTKHLLRHTFPFALCSYPTVNVPCGVGTEGLPIGLQITGANLSKTLSTAQVVDAYTTHHLLRPPL